MEEVPDDIPTVSAELPYESRYFTVFLEEDGSTLSVNTGKIASVDSSTAVRLARNVLSKNKSHGFSHRYRYVVYTINNEYHVIFLDCTRAFNSFYTFAYTSVGVCLLGLLSMGLLLFFLSKLVVRPFALNYEKQRRFITDAGHELKTPLTIINADLELLEMDYGENEWTADMKSQSRRLAKLTEELIFLSRAQEDAPPLSRGDFSLSQVITEISDSFQAVATTRNRTLETRILPNQYLNGEEQSIYRLINILVDNAVKYSTEGSTIFLSLDKKKDSLIFTITNETEGLHREDLPHLFDRFYRSDRSRSFDQAGYGLGLSIANAIVRAHRGKITATTADERSLTMQVVLPCN